MNPLLPLPYSFFQSNPTLFDDAEMLQTDVMRFFAILSLCLMAIFALVKTLPMAPPDTRPAMAEPADQKAEAKRLQNNLGQILKDIADKRRVRSELSNQIKNENQSLAKIRKKMEQVQEKMDQNYQLNQEPLQKPSELAPPPASSQKGFTLRFASDKALEKLIAAGKVNFYAIAGKNAWRIKRSDGSLIYIAAEFPRQIYEMETHTVPNDYIAVFRRQIAVFGRRTLTWGVTLPGQTTDAINQMVRIREGGDLIITADGQVTLN
jgi:hypothetical protein